MAAEITGSGSGGGSGSSLNKVTFVLSWKTSGTSFAGSSRGDGASGKFSFGSGLDWTDYRVILQHDLNTEYLDLSALDVNAEFQSTANMYLDIGAVSDVVATYIDANKTELKFGGAATAGSIFKITFIG